jgi:hypothetical protein
MTVQLVLRAVVVIALLMLTASNWPREARAQVVDELASLRTRVSQLDDLGRYAEARQKHGEFPGWALDTGARAATSRPSRF